MAASGSGGALGGGGGGTPDRWLVIAVVPRDPLEAELIAQAMVDVGGRAVWEEGGRLVTHLAAHSGPEAAIEALRDRLAHSPVELESWWQPHADWAETWKEGLAPRRIGRRLIVTPTWCDPDVNNGDVVVRLDPGMAFGTAEHGTTRGCLRLLERTVEPGDRILDVGTGSGILAIAAALLGAGRVHAIDGDPFAVEAATDNAEANGVQSAVAVEEAWASVEELEASGPWDGVVANIETGILRPLLSGLAAAVREGGWLLLSGILDHELDGLVADAESHALTLDRVDDDGEWRSVLFRN